ncbi:MAG: hypothetical protein ACRD3N_17450 [Terracidiphilus sp.]
MTAIDALLGESIDYAGLYPPASLDMHTAVRTYLEFGRSSHARALGRFIVDLERFPYLWDAAGDYLRGLRLSAIASLDADWEDLHRLVANGFAIESIEIKGAMAAEIGPIASRIPSGVTAYFEIPIDAPLAILDALAAAGARVKLRMGGVSAGAFPSTQAIAHMLDAISRRRMVFKATAGLHHPVRAKYPLTCEPGSPTAAMHGFMNLACAAAVLHFGGDVADAFEALEELEPDAWRVAPEAIAWRVYGWNGDELREVRRKFFAGFGSCSFLEPIRELEALGWL